MTTVFKILLDVSKTRTPLSYSRFYATLKKVEPALAKGKKKLGKFGPVVEKKTLPVEGDVNRLVNYVCGTNLLKENGEDVKLKPDSEYPEWLWSIRTGPAPTLDELDPETMAYWKKVRRLGMKRNNLLGSLKKF